MAILITGAAGFIGCNLVATLLQSGQRVIGVDNLSRGTLANLVASRSHAHFEFIEADVAGPEAFTALTERLHKTNPIHEIWHMAANSDIPAGVSDARVDLRDTFMTTFSVLQAAKACQIPIIAFASSSAIYGDLKGVPLTEDIGPLFPISNYGAMKLASEAAITAAAESFLQQAFIFRFPNVIGTPATHGVVYDFVKRLRANPERLDVLGDGTQQKSYLHVESLVDAMLYVREKAKERVSCYNIGVDDEGVTVRFIAEETIKAVAPGAAIAYGTSDRGWIGDVPRFRYSIDKLRALGWQPRASSAESMRCAIQQIAAQKDI